MFVAMNRFRVREGREGDFEEMWRTRESYLTEVPGFVSFALLKNETASEGATEFISHSTWGSREDFWAWANSDAFRKAHAQSSVEGVLEGPPHVSLYGAVLEQARAGA